MRREVYQELLQLLDLPVGACPNIKLTSERFPEYLAGEDLLMISAAVDFPPCMLLRRMLESCFSLSKQVGDPMKPYMSVFVILFVGLISWRVAVVVVMVGAWPSAVDFPPCMLLRRMLESCFSLSKQSVGEILKAPHALENALTFQSNMPGPQVSFNISTTATATATATVHTHPNVVVASTRRALSVGEILKAPHALENALKGQSNVQPPQHVVLRLQRDIVRSVLADCSYSSFSDVAKQAAAAATTAAACWPACWWCEPMLLRPSPLPARRCCAAARFLLSASPDNQTADTQVPIAVRTRNHESSNSPEHSSTTGTDSGWRVVTWIDSKATFGDERTHYKQLEEQYSTYVNRYGPGLVIYWFGFIDDLAQSQWRSSADISGGPANSGPDNGAVIMKDLPLTPACGDAGLSNGSVKLKGYDVTLACKDQARGAAAQLKLRELVPDSKVELVMCDLADLGSVRDCAASLLDKGSAFDVVLNNAGVMATPKLSTKQGHEFQFGVNHLGHFALTNCTAAISYIGKQIDFGDINRDKSYDPQEAYGQSKLANIMFTYELANKLKDSPNVTANCLHPGVVRTELGRYMVNDTNRWYMGPIVNLALKFFLTPEDGAKTSIYLASSPDVDTTTGKYFSECKVIFSSPSSYDAEVARKLWQLSEELTA
eukprot:gene14350-20345_t